MLVTRVLLENSLAGSRQSYNLIAALLGNLQILIPSYFHHLHIFNDDLAFSPIGPLEVNVLLKGKIVRIGKEIVLVIVGLDRSLEFCDRFLILLAEVKLKEERVAYLNVFVMLSILLWRTCLDL